MHPGWTHHRIDDGSTHHKQTCRKEKVNVALCWQLFNYKIMFLCSIVLSVLCPGLNLVWQRG